MDTKKKIELDFCVIQLLQQDVVQYELNVNMPLTTEKAEVILKTCNELVKGKYYLLNIMNAKLQPSADVFDFYASKKRQEHIIADAFVLNSPALKMMSNFYLKLKKPQIPTKVFSDSIRALAWIEQMKREEQ